jgi:HAE1 family hydrophobic/amphiphilic exporter-1
VFIPVLFMGGIVGRLLHEFAVTIAAAILVSGVVSVSLDADACARASSGRRTRLTTGGSTSSPKRLRLTQAAYAFTLSRRCRFHPVAMVISWRSWVGPVYLFNWLPTGFIPNEDTGQLMGQTEGLQGVGFGGDDGPIRSRPRQSCPRTRTCKRWRT